MSGRVVSSRTQDAMRAPWRTADIAEVIGDVGDEDPRPHDLTEHMPDDRGRWKYVYDAENSRDGRHKWRVIPATSPAVDNGEGTLRARQLHYDPARTGLLDDEFEGQILRRYPSRRGTQFVDPSTTDHRNELIDYLDTPQGMLWRGMSADEYEEAQQRGYFESAGDHNIGDYQVGKTFFTTRPSSAANYADGFAPYQYKPTFERPGYVVGIPDRPDAPRGPLGDDPKDHEVGLEGRIPFSEVQKTYVGRPHAISEGLLELIKEPWEETYGRPMVNHPRVDIAWEDLTPDPPLPPKTAAEDLLKDPRWVEPEYFTGIHEMGHGLDFAGDFSAGRAYDTAAEIYRQQFPDREPAWGPGDPQFRQWVRTQLPRAAFEGGGADGKWYLHNPEALAHAFTEVRLNPQANELSRALHDQLVKSQEGRDKHGPLSVGPGVPQGFLDAIGDVQADHPAADVNRVDLTPVDHYGPAWMEGPGPFKRPPESDEPPRMRIDQQYANPAQPDKFDDWFDGYIDQGHYPRWQSTTAGEPWPEDAIEDMMTEFDRPSKTAWIHTAMPAPTPPGMRYVYHPDNSTIPRDPTGNEFMAPAVEALLNDERVGFMEWYPEPYGDKHGEVSLIKVNQPYRRMGIGTGMYDFARQHVPEIHHSELRSGLGDSWVHYEQQRTAAADYHPHADGEYHPRYEKAHDWITEHHGQPQRCERCGRTDPDAQYEWATTGEPNTRDIENYSRLCKGCHNDEDGVNVQQQRESRTAALPPGYQVRRIKPINPYDSDFASGLFAPDDDKPVSTLEWSKGGEVMMIHTRPEYRAEHGLASALYDHTLNNFDPELHHSEMLSPDGAAWAKKTYGWDPSPGGKDSIYEMQFNASRSPFRVASFPQFGIRHALITDDTIYGLSGEFTQWARDLALKNPRDENLPDNQYRKLKRGPVGYWPYIEQFLQERYPAAYRGLEYGHEEARALMDGTGGEGEDDHPSAALYRADPYETGPEAFATHGYDPKETAAAMLLLHNDSHHGRQDWRGVDTARLTDIMQKRFNMQRDYDKRQESAPTKAPEPKRDDMPTFMQKMEQERQRLQAEPKTRMVPAQPKPEDPGSGWGTFAAPPTKQVAAAIFPPHDEGWVIPDNQRRQAPADARWYHVSPEKFEPGARLRPFGGDSQYQHMYNDAFKHRDQHVWTEYRPTTAEGWATGPSKNIYEIIPDETPQAWNGNGVDGWVTPGATIKRQISDNYWLPQGFDEHTASADLSGKDFYVDVFADPDGTGVWKTTVDRRTGEEKVEFLPRPGR